MGILPSAWETERLIVRDSQFEEIEELRDLFNACSYVGKWDPTFYVVDTNEIAEHVSRSLSSEVKDGPRFRMQTIHLRPDKRIIGYFHLTQGEPKADLIWISMFVIHPEYQVQRYGYEVVKGLKEQLRQLSEYRAVWLEVYLKNWPALRFWLGQGFSRIVAYDGDKVHSAESHATLVLEMAL